MPWPSSGIREDHSARPDHADLPSPGRLCPQLRLANDASRDRRCHMASADRDSVVTELLARSVVPPADDSAGNLELCGFPIDDDCARIKSPGALPCGVDLDDAEGAYDLPTLRDGELLPALPNIGADQVDEDGRRGGEHEPGSRLFDLVQQV